MTGTKLVSVIIPVYNVAPYLREALDSVLRQTYSNLEILVVDDGSTDGSGEICDEYSKDPRIRLIHQGNRGLSAARNTALDCMNGEYVAFLDSDDAFHPDMIRTMVDSAEQEDADLVICGYGKYKKKLAKYCRFDRFKFKEKEVLPSELALKRLMSGKINVMVWNKLYKSWLWEERRFPEDHIFEDIWVMSDLLELAQRIVLLPHELILHRKREGSITTTKSVDHVREYILTKHQLMKYVEDHMPEVFSQDDLIKLHDNVMRGATVLYAECKSQKNTTEKAQIRQELLAEWKSMAGQKLCIKSRIAYILLKHVPGLILPVRSFFLFVKRIYR